MCMLESHEPGFFFCDNDVRVTQKRAAFELALNSTQLGSQVRAVSLVRFSNLVWADGRVYPSGGLPCRQGSRVHPSFFFLCLWCRDVHIPNVDCRSSNRT